MGSGVWRECGLTCLDDSLGSDKGLSGVQEPQQPLNDAIHILHLCAYPPQCSTKDCPL